MKLQLTVLAQNLNKVIRKSGKELTDGLYAVVSEVHENEKTSTVVGKTEVLKSRGGNYDWIKILFLDGFQLGKSMNLVISLHIAPTDEELGVSTTFEVGTVLGTKGGIQGKEVKFGGIMMVHVERYSGLGTFNLKMRGVRLQSEQAQVDALFELQQKRQTVKGKVVWDTVFRSRPIENNEHPIWDDACIELSALCNGELNQKFRLMFKDFDDEKDNHTPIGWMMKSVNELIGAVTPENGDGDNIDELDTGKSLKVFKGRGKNRKKVGDIIVLSAYVDKGTDAGTNEEEEEETNATSRGNVDDDNNEEEEEEEIIVEATEEDEIIIPPMGVDDGDGNVGNMTNVGPTFADYIAGGCQLRVIVAIDYTASNGNPQKEDSLHYFRKDGGLNVYQTAISKICSVLAEYDSDQKYPVWGFGAKRKGEEDVNHCFSCSTTKKETKNDTDEVDGVDGILSAYMNTFQSGIAMSKPTNITKVIQAAGENSREALIKAAQTSGQQEYTILIIFTNGNVHNVEKTKNALNDVKNDPLSIIVVGVGPSTFNDMSFLNDNADVDVDVDDKSKNSRVQFVDMKTVMSDEDADDKSNDRLTEETLKDIPQQLVQYFVSKDIQPNPPMEPEDIIIEPFNGNEGEDGNDDDDDDDDDIPINLTTPADAGSDVVQIEEKKKPSKQNNNNNNNKPGQNNNSNKNNKMFNQVSNMGKKMMTKQGNRIIARQKKRFGRVQKKFQKQFDKMVDQKIGGLFK